jgi:cell division protein FtsQ
VVRQLDSGGARYSQELSEIDLSDPEDIKVLANNPEGEVLVHLGTSNYLERYKIYISHVQQWRQQFQKLESVDLRYDRQIIVNPDMEGAPKQAPLTVAAAKKAMAAGVKPAALITGKIDGPKPIAEPKPAESKRLNKSARLRRAKSRTRARVAGHPASKPSQPALASKKPSPSIARQQN